MNQDSDLSLRVKRPRPSNDFYESMMCLICSDFFKPPIVQCNKGHSYCQSCVQKTGSLLEQKKSCAVCRSPILLELRNYQLEQLLDKFTVQCTHSLKGCSKVVTLSQRPEHEKMCEFRPQISCYYKEFKNCQWKGDSGDLAEHLTQAHDVQELVRGMLFRYLWNPPNEHIWRYRYRVLKQVIGGDSEPFTFILEHYYSSDDKLLCFLIRSPDTDVKKRYRISILNRNDEANKIAFEGVTLNFEEFGHIKDFSKGDLTKMLLVTYQQIMSFSFVCEEDQAVYFSIQIQFF
ncbi:unnamed protein product [Blepharisma stoltei]|uniref:RING-type E3 ubiquitin transferase n=1 Tax=Blepharisma stoltei TaxID=1481888 RepID=A0AAU9JGR6_9CILI|nr:unnamed protein product [Blepharisma stoltei]